MRLQNVNVYVWTGPQSQPCTMKFRSEFRFVYFLSLLINSKLLRDLVGRACRLAEVSCSYAMVICGLF